MPTIKYMLLTMMLCFVSYSHASKVDTLLDEYNNKNSLSHQTIDENKGHLVLYSREKLESMHARTLKDVFKTTPVLYYNENRFGLPDPLSGGLFEPYRSNFIRIYIDGVESTQGWMGSGIVLYGDMNIDFVDHIEFYYNIPSFESSSEPAYLTIFLYSKEAGRDGGAKVSLMGANRGYNVQSASFGEKKEGYSYMINLSHTDAKREKIDNGTNRPLSRDFKRTQLFSYIKSENQIFHLQVMQKKTDSLAGISLDATPTVSEIDYMNVHIDYGIKLSEHWKAQFTYEYLETDSRQEDDNIVMYTERFPSKSLISNSKNSTFTSEITYKNTIGKHRITTGIKNRLKKLNSFSIKELGELPTLFDNENIFSFFFQDQYSIEENQLLTLGLGYSKITRDDSVADDDLFQLRLGYIFKGEKWSYKTYIYRTMFALDPFGRYLQEELVQSVEPQITKGITQEVSFRDKNYYVRIIALYMKDENGLLENKRAGETEYFFTTFNFKYDFDLNNAMDIQLYYARYENIFNLDYLEDYSGYVSFSNRYEKWTFYNGVVWHNNTIDNKNYFDITSSISWDMSITTSFMLKGDNILNRAKETNFYRVNPTTGAPLSPLFISPIDRRISLEIEYRF